MELSIAFPEGGGGVLWGYIVPTDRTLRPREAEPSAHFFLQRKYSCKIFKNQLEVSAAPGAQKKDRPASQATWNIPCPATAGKRETNPCFHTFPDSLLHSVKGRMP